MKYAAPIGIGTSGCAKADRCRGLPARQAAASACIRLPPLVIVWLSDFTST